MEQVSPQVRLIAVLGLVLALLGGGATMLMGRNAAAAAEDEALPPSAVQGALNVAARAQTTADAATARAKSVDAQTAEAAPAAAPKPAAKPKAAAKPKPAPTVAPNGLPMSIATALNRYEVVVVSLYASGAALDATALEEARAGAKDAGAGFVAVNVLDAKQSEPLAKLLGVDEPPAVLVYRSPDELLYRFDGFVDLATVSQAASTARS